MAPERMPPFSSSHINTFSKQSLQIGYFQRGVENALVKPLLKNLGLELVFPSFKPVSNLPFIPKLTEKASLNQLSDHMNIGFGVAGTALKWFTSYLPQRTEQVQIKGTLWEKKQLTTPLEYHRNPALALCRPLPDRKAPPQSPALCRWPIQTHSFHESNCLSYCRWQLCGRIEELDDFQHANGEWQQDRILDCRK